MGNQLSACACGQKEQDIDEKKRPLDKPEPVKEKKPKKKRSFLKRRKKKKDGNNNKEEDSTPEESPPHAPGVKDIIRVYVDRPAESPSDNRLHPGRRDLYPPASPSGSIAPAKPNRLLSRSGSASPSPIVRFADDGDIDVSGPHIEIHDSVDKAPERIRQAVAQGTPLPDPVIEEGAKAKIQDELAKQGSWLSLDERVREQYDIVYYMEGEPPRGADEFNIQEIVVIVQREIQKVYVIVTPENIYVRRKILSQLRMNDSTKPQCYYC